MKKVLLCSAIFGLVLMLGCEHVDSDSEQAIQQRESLREANAQIGMPAIKNFQERKIAKLILELRDQGDLITYAYIVNMQGGLVYLGRCIGYGLPYATQYTSPIKPHGTMGEGEPQADPNGLFMPGSADGTWLMMIGPDNKPHPVYCEPRVIVSPFKL